MRAAVDAYGASTTSRYRRSKAEIARLKDALYAGAEEEQPVTCRRLFYLLVSAGLIEKTEGEYQRTVIRLLGQMRESGELPFPWIADNRRLMQKPDSFRSMAHALDTTARLYRRSLWSAQSDYCEIWCEKSGLTGVLYDVTSSWDVPLMLCNGSPSKSFLWTAAQDIAARDKPAHIYYLGDHDPSGVTIRQRTERDLKRYAGEDCDLRFEALAVLPEQIERYRLPTRPTKKSDPNAAKFKGESVEVDAVPANTLRALVKEAIMRWIDRESLHALLQVENAERETLASLAFEVREVAAS